MIDAIVNRLVKLPHIIGLFQGDIQDAEEQIRFMLTNSSLDESEVDDYFLTLHNKK
ncbi:hypothetical protein [Fictibacillus phosphorivorans]|uniref:hypothetical protein n=1 Tax=Fictibacillus phosphorivorans TaxID=1221500 RepID=UPI0016432794|nr:hypothetical protein [Fictibacillus phosphorivorans]